MALSAHLPQGRRLPASEWRRRHLLVCAVLGLHLVILLGLDLVPGRGDAGTFVGTAAVALSLIAAMAPVQRRTRAVAATFGLVSSSAVLVQLSHGAPVMHVHYVLAVAISAVYEDWATYATAILFVVGEHLGVSVASPGRWVADDIQPLRYSVVDLVFVVGTSATQLVFWTYANQSRERDLAYQAELAELSRGRTTVEARIAELDATREDLLATVSHEFRTPLTAIQGAALTMRKHRARLPEHRVNEMLDAVVANTERLGRLLENMLTAAEARVPDQRAVTDVASVATEVAMLVEQAHIERTPSVVVAIVGGLEARVEASALHQILANLLDNAIVHAQDGSNAIISAATEGEEIVVTVANEAEGVDAQMLADLFEPFTQRDSSSTRQREGAGVGLYVVRRLVEVSRGSLSVRSQPGWVSVEVRLPRATPRTVDLNAQERFAER